MVNGGWIRVEERLPENDVKVLLLFNFLDNHIESGFITNLFYDSEEWVHYLYDGDSYDENPTHWMPLPAAPELKVSTSSANLLREKLKCPLQREFNPLCEHNWISNEGRTMSGYLCSICGDYSGPMGVKND